MLPQGTRTTLLPTFGDLSFVGVPALDNSLATSSYELSGSAVTGPSGNDPVSVVAAIETTDANDPVTIGGFFSIPTLVSPGASAWGGTRVQLQASGPVDLAVFTVSSGGGLVQWEIVAPGSDLSFTVPDLAQVPGSTRWCTGPSRPPSRSRASPASSTARSSPARSRPPRGTLMPRTWPPGSY